MAKNITTFYEAFQSHNAKEMADHYHEKATFSDPVFTHLNAQQVRAMWHMLVERADGDLNITFHDVQTHGKVQKCTWEAQYHFRKTNRPVHNIIRSEMTFEDGKIIKHKDTFDFWKWSRMALGWPGILLGWTPLLKNKVRSQAQYALNKYMHS